MSNIQWYPGHMAKTVRLIKEDVKLIDVVIELLDARVPLSSKNPEIDDLSMQKKHIYVLNKSDLSGAQANNYWKNYYEQTGSPVLLCNAQNGHGAEQIVETSRLLMREKIESQKKRGRIFMPIRAMIVGIPNVGKSTLINRFVSKAITKVGDKPGVTKAKQWVKIKKDFELLDTPGLLWPKFENREIGINLAITGAINEQILDANELCYQFIKKLLLIDKNALNTRYHIDFDNAQNPNEIIQKIGSSRGFKTPGGGVDTERTSIMILDEFRAGKLGKICLDSMA